MALRPFRDAYDGRTPSCLEVLSWRNARGQRASRSRDCPCVVALTSAWGENKNNCGGARRPFPVRTARRGAEPPCAEVSRPRLCLRRPTCLSGVTDVSKHLPSRVADPGAVCAPRASAFFICCLRHTCRDARPVRALRRRLRAPLLSRRRSGRFSAERCSRARGRMR